MTTNPTATVPELAGFEGERIAPGDPGYDEARAVFLGNIDRRPAAIFRPSSAEDAARVVGLARDSGLELAVRGGGHSSAGHGVKTGEYTKAAWEHVLATGFGDAGTVGIGGVTWRAGSGSSCASTG